MKIIQVIPNLGIGGAEIMCESLTYELIRKGHSVIVISLYNLNTEITARLKKNNIDIRFLNKKRGLNISVIRKLRKIIKQENPDVVHSHLYAIKYVVLSCIFSKKTRCIHTVHNIASKETTKIGLFLNKIFFKCKKAIPVALSKQIQKSIVEVYHLKSENVPIVYNGIDLSKCNRKTNYEIKGNVKILHIGRFMEQKNHAGLIDAFKLFHDKFPKSELQLIGDGPLREEIDIKVRDYRLESCVTFMGLQKDVYNYLHDADIFVLPSLYEGMPMTLIEAMGTGLPIIATCVGGVPDMLDNVSALLVPINTVEITRAFEKYYTDLNLRRHHGEAALELSKKFSASFMAEGYLKIYFSERK